MNLGVKVRFLMLGQTINLALSNHICQLIVCTVQWGLVLVPDPHTQRSGLVPHPCMRRSGLVPHPCMRRSGLVPHPCMRMSGTETKRGRDNSASDYTNSLVSNMSFKDTQIIG